MAMTALWDFGERAEDAEAVLPLLSASGADEGPAPSGGAVSVVFSQLLHIGPGDDTVVSFEHADSTLRLSVGEDGAVRMTLGEGAQVAAFSTQDGFLAAGDTLRATLAWGAGEATLSVENLFSGAVHESTPRPAPGLPESIEDPEFWALPSGGGNGQADGEAGTVFLGSLLAIGFYDSPDDAAEVLGFGVEPATATPDADDLIGGAVLDLDSDDAETRVALEIPEAEDGMAYVLSFRASDIAAEGDSFRVFWNGAPAKVDGATEVFPPDDGYAEYAVHLTGGSGDGSNTLEFLGQGGDGGVAIALEDVRLVPVAGDDAPGQDRIDDTDTAADVALFPVSIAVEGGASAQASSLGAYVVDPETGAISAPEILFQDTQTTLHDGTVPPGSEADYMAPAGAQIGLFLIGGGAHYNDFAALGQGNLAFLNEAGAPATLADEEPLLYHIGLDGTLTLIDGPVYHAAGFGAHAALNPDAANHVAALATNDDGTQLFGFTDSFAAKDADGFGDLLVSVDARAAGAEVLHSGLADAGPDAAQDESFLLDEQDLALDLAAPDAAQGDAGDGAMGLLILLPTARVVPEPLDDAIFPDEPANVVDAPSEMSAQLASVTIVPCFTPGTLIDTAHGRVPVETLCTGDRVLTRDHGFQTLEWVGRKDVSAEELAEKPRYRGVRIRAGALGAGLPERDMVVSPQHRILVIGPEAELMFGTHEVLVPAIHMIGIPGIEADTAPEISYIHIMCRRHEIVRSEGLWSESFQPGDLSLAGLDREQREELLSLFPELVTRMGRSNYVSARRSLHRYETLALMAPRSPRRLAKKDLA